MSGYRGMQTFTPRAALDKVGSGQPFAAVGTNDCCADKAPDAIAAKLATKLR